MRTGVALGPLGPIRGGSAGKPLAGRTASAWAGPLHADQVQTLYRTGISKAEIGSPTTDRPHRRILATYSSEK
jgi:hypothetical protein